MAGNEIRFSAPDVGDAEVAAATRALLSGWITTGEECLALEAELAAYLDVEHVVAVSSCTAALEIAVAHLGCPAGSRIGVPTWTFVSTALGCRTTGGCARCRSTSTRTRSTFAPTALRAAIDGPGAWTR